MHLIVVQNGHVQELDVLGVILRWEDTVLVVQVSDE
jgi:hypothetical protein